MRNYFNRFAGFSFQDIKSAALATCVLFTIVKSQEDHQAICLYAIISVSVRGSLKPELVRAA